MMIKSVTTSSQDSRKREDYLMNAFSSGSHAYPIPQSPKNFNESSTIGYTLIDDKPDLLAESYRLRYQIYCAEKGFLSSDKYPGQMEIDQYDESSMHIAAINEDGEVLGTARMVKSSAHGFPFERYCKLFDKVDIIPGLKLKHPQDLLKSERVVEISRFAIKKPSRQQQSEIKYVGDSSVVRLHPMHTTPNVKRIKYQTIAKGLYKMWYKVSKANGITHWFAAMEKSLPRLLARNHIIFEAIGPEVDYYGPVRPYIVALTDIEQRLKQKAPKLYEEWQRAANGEDDLMPFSCEMDSGRKISLAC